MAQTTYCSFCGSRNDYAITKPKFCGSCGKEMSKAYVNEAPTPTNTPVKRDPKQPIVVAPVTSGKRRPISRDEDGEEGDSYNKDEVLNMAHELAASISAEEFGVTLKKIGGGGYSLKDVLDPSKNIDVGNRGAVAELLPQSE